MKETRFTRHRNTIEPVMIAEDRESTLQTIKTDVVIKATNSRETNKVLDDRTPLINNTAKDLTRWERATLTQLRSGYCKLRGSYKSMIEKDARLNVSADCGNVPHGVKHLFVCRAHSTSLTLPDLWSRPTDAIRHESQLLRGRELRLR